MTQRFHMARALYDARRAGLHATGFVADRRDYGRVMRRLELREALARGIPSDDLFTDHAGFDTWDSAQRARRVFDVRSVVVVTQRFHMARALYDARRAGLTVTGYAADRRDYGHVMPRLQVREAAARVKTIGDVVTSADPHFLGARIPITGDGRVSWG